MLAYIEKLVRAAGEIQMRHFERLEKIDFKGTRDLLTVADLEVEKFLIEKIAGDYPDHEIFAEESAFHPKGASFRWFLDPLDGTTNFSHGYPMFACTVALARDGLLTHAGAYAPYLEECYLAERGQGAYLDGSRMKVSPHDDLMRCVLGTGFSYNRDDVTHDNTDNFLNLFHEIQGIRRGGCAAIDLAYVAAGRLDGFWELYLCPWDVASGALMIEEAGGLVTDFSGGDGWLYGENIVATNGRIHEALRAHLTGMDEGYPYRFRKFTAR